MSFEVFLAGLCWTLEMPRDRRVGARYRQVRVLLLFYSTPGAAVFGCSRPRHNRPRATSGSRVQLGFG